MIRRPPRSTLSSSSAASDVYKRQLRINDLFLEGFPAHTVQQCQINCLTYVLFSSFLPTVESRHGLGRFHHNQVGPVAIYPHFYSNTRYQKEYIIRNLYFGKKCFGCDNLLSEFILCRFPTISKTFRVFFKSRPPFNDLYS